MAGKVANGQGGAYQQPDGRWRAYYRLPGDHTRRAVLGRTKADAEAKAAAAAGAALPTPGMRRRTRFTSATTVATLGAAWLDDVARHRVRPSSLGKYRARVERIASGLIGSIEVGELGVEQVTAWQSELLDTLAPGTVGDLRTTLREVLGWALDLGLVASNVVDRVKPPKQVASAARALTAAETSRLVGAARPYRLGAGVALLFVQGWRASEVLGLAWGDVDLDAGVATVRRACVYVDGQGAVVGATKTSGALGRHHLAPTVVELLRLRRRVQLEARIAAGPRWQTRSYEGEALELVFTNPAGGLMLRQSLTKAISRAAIAAGLDPTGLGTHSGRRSVVTALYAEGGLDLSDIARHVGHASPATTAGYVRALGDRPVRTAEVAARLLDPMVGAGGGARPCPES